MANGDIGSLYVTLGVKDAVTSALKKLQQELGGTDEKAQKAQATLRAIGAELRKPSGEQGFTHGVSELVKLLEKSKGEVKNLSVALKSLGGRDLGMLFGKPTNETNVKDHLRLIRYMRDQLEWIGKTPGTDGSRLVERLRQAMSYLTIINNMKTDIGSLRTLRSGSGDGMRQDFQQGLERMMSLRDEMVRSFNDGSWEKAQKRHIDSYRQCMDQMLKLTEKIDAKLQKRSPSSGSGVKETTRQANEASKAVEHLGESGERTRKTLDGIGKGVNKVLDAFLGKDAKTLPVERASALASQSVTKLLAMEKELQRLKKNIKVDDEGRVTGKEEYDAYRQALRNALQYLEVIQKIATEQRKIQDTRSENPNVDPGKLRAATRLLEAFYSEMLKVQSLGRTGVDKALTIGDYGKSFSMAQRRVRELVSSFSKDNPLSVFTGNTDKVNSTLSDVTERYRKLLDLMEEGRKKGYDTSMLNEHVYALKNRISEMEALYGKSSKRLADQVYMKGLFSETAADMTRAKNAMSAYGREKSKAMARDKAADDIRSQVERAAAAEYERQRKQAERLRQEREQELKELSEYGKRYMALQEARRVADERASAAQKKAWDERKRQLAHDTEQMSRLYAQLSRQIGIAEGVGMKGVDLGAKTSGLDKVLSEAAKLKKRIEDTNIALVGKASDREGMEWYVAQVNRLRTSLQNATDAQKELNKAKEKMNKAVERAERKREAREAAELRQMAHEAQDAERRLLSLEGVLAKLRGEYDKGVGLGASTVGTDTIMRELEAKIQHLTSLRDALRNGDSKALGQMGNIGDGRDLAEARRQVALQRQANKAASDEQKRVNKEKEESIALERKHREEVARTARKVRSDLVKAFEEARRGASGVGGAMADVKSLLLQGGVVYGAQRFLMSVIETGGELERQHIALQSILGDMQNANTLFGQVKQLALQSPFTFSELNADVKQLAAYGVEYNELYDTTKRLADMASGLGVSFERIALAFGQVQARGWLDGKELRQIAYAGIPLLQKLSEYYSKREGRKVTTSEVKTRISGRGVDFADVKNIFWEMTDAGGQFYNMQEVLSETLLGRWNKLKDAWEIMLSDFADGKSALGGTLIFAIDKVTELVQLMHTLSPLVLGALGGFALKKLSLALGGQLGKNFLSGKDKAADSMVQRLAQGEKLNAVERMTLLTRRQITMDDLKRLARARALTSVDVQRLRVSGQITAAQYEQTMNLLKQRTLSAGLTAEEAKRLGLLNGNVWQRFSTRMSAAFGVVGNKLKTLVSSLWAMVGGWPGMIVTAVSMGIGYLWSQYEELSDSIRKTQEELQQRVQNISEYLHDNPVEVAIKAHDTKALDSLIDSYKEKLKDLSGPDYDGIVLNASKKSDRAEELKYLRERLRLLEKGAELSSGQLGRRGVHSSAHTLGKDMKDALDDYMKARSLALRFGATSGDKADFADASNAFARLVRQAAQWMKQLFPDALGKNGAESQEAVKSFLNQVAEKFEFSDEQTNLMRASVLSAMGLHDGWLSNVVGDEMGKLIDESSSTISAKIRNGQALTQAEKAKVEALMEDAKKNIGARYPDLSGYLKGLLRKDKFEIVIDMVLGRTPTQNQLEAEMMRGVSAGDKDYPRYASKSQQLSKTGSAYQAKNQIKQEVDDALNELEARKRAGFSKAYIAEAQKTYDEAVDYAEKLLHYRYTGETKKSNKDKKGSQQDKALEDLRRRVQLYKKLYGELKRYRDLYGEQAMQQLKHDGEFVSVFGDKSRFPLTDVQDYALSMEQLMGTLKATTQERKDYMSELHGDIQGERRIKLEETRKSELDVLTRQLDVISEQYTTYKKLYDLTGDKAGSMSVAFGGSVQNSSYRKYLEEQLGSAVSSDNLQGGHTHTAVEVAGMSVEATEQAYGEESRTYVLRKKLEEEDNRLKKESLDLLSELIEKNATVSQQIADENTRYERLKQLLGEIKDPAMRQRASEGLEKSHRDAVSKLELEQFKDEKDWQVVFDDVKRVSSATLATMATDIDTFSKKGQHSVEVIKTLREALQNLRDEQISRDPMAYIFGGARRGDAIGELLKEGPGADGRYKVSAAWQNRTGLKKGKYTRAELENAQAGAYQDSSTAISSVSDKMRALGDVLQPVTQLFEALGKQDSVLGKVTGGATGALSSAAGMANNMNILGGMKGMGFLKSAGPYAAMAAAAMSVTGTLIKAFGADYSSYNKAKHEYDTLVDTWDKLISKKKEYLSESWGEEAQRAAEESARLYAAELTATQELARKRLGSGASAGSHTIGYRMWAGSYKDSQGRTWSDVAGDISRKLGVRFSGMSDLLTMSREQLEWIMTAYPTLWAHMDGDFKEQLEKIMDIRKSVDDLSEDITEKLTGLKFDTLVNNWADALSQMSNGADALVDNVEEGLKKAIVSGMLNNLYRERIQALVDEAKAMTENADKETDSEGRVLSEISHGEYRQLTSDTEALAKAITATRDYMKKLYGWSDTSSSKSTNSVQGVSEETADLLASYVNAVRLDVSVGREQRQAMLERMSVLPDMGEIEKSQLRQLTLIAENTRRSAEAAEALLDVMESVTTAGRKKVYVS